MKNGRDIYENFEQHTSEEIVAVLKEADDLYHNDCYSFLSDDEYDTLRRYLAISDPTNPYLIGVGSDVRGGKVDLPFEMGSLNQVEIGDINDWVNKHNLRREETVVSDKMDGTSVMIVYDANGDFQIAYSRGNGVQGADISRHISKIKNVPQNIGRQITVRAEVELTETAFETLRTKITRHSSKDTYKNARNMVAGLMNRKENPEIVYDYLTVIAYEIVSENETNKLVQLDELANHGFQVVDYTMFFGHELTDEALAEHLNDRREKTDYAIDGVVIEVNDIEKRLHMNPTRDTLNPEYAIKYKVADASNLAVATVVGVTWNISKHGYLKPQVNVEPVELVGVTIQNATGFNAKFIESNGIGPGAKVQITRSGDVIPFIQKVIEPAAPQMPEEDFTWSENYVDAILSDRENHDEVVAQQLIDFFASIDAPNLKEGSVRKVLAEVDDTNFTTAVIGILSLTEAEWVKVIGKNGSKIHDGLQNKFTDIPLHVLMGSLPYFGRGVGKRKFKKLEKAFGTNELHTRTISDPKLIASVEGFEEKTAQKIVEGVDAYYNFYSLLPKYVEIEVMEDNSGGSLDGHKICMTGFHDKDMAASIEAAGGEVQSGVSGKTTLLVCKDPNSTSGKVKKAKDKGIKVISIDEMKAML